MRDFCKRTPGSLIEKKDYSICWHYRASPNGFAEYQARKLSIELNDATSALPVTVVSGDKIVEARAAEANKGTFIRWYLKNLKDPDHTYFLAIGDDEMDEELFAALRSEDISIRVGTESAHADYLIKSYREVQMLLSYLARNAQMSDSSPMSRPNFTPEQKG